jgi:hypothetical protein
MKRLILSLALALSVACGGITPVVPVPYETVRDQVVAGVGEARAALESAAKASVMARARIASSALPDRVVDTLEPALDRLEAAINEATAKLNDGVQSLADLDAILGPVVTSRTALADLIRLHDVLSDIRAILDVLPSRVQ